MAEQPKRFVLEGAQIIFRNFAGREGPYNREGIRRFVVKLPSEELAQEMFADGWNVKYLRPREEGDLPAPYIPVEARYDKFPPRVILITSRGRTELDEADLDVLDWVDIANADLIARGSFWNVNGKTGYKAYLRSLYVTINEDELERKYAINEEAPEPGE